MNIKNTGFILCFFTLLATTTHARSNHYSPVLCPPRDLRIEIQNKSAEAQRFWTQNPRINELEEIPFDIGARTKNTLRGTQFLNEAAAFAMKDFSIPALQYQFQCEGLPSIRLTQEHNPDQYFTLNTGSTTLKFYLLNLYLRNNNVELKAFDARGTLIDEKKVELKQHYDTHEFKWTLKSRAHRVELRAENRINSLLSYQFLGRETMAYPHPLAPRKLETPSDAVYFLVTTRDREASESFVVGISEPEKIALAREQIRDPELEKILVAGIRLGHNEINRSFSEKSRTPYSWSVFRVDAFADFAHIDCDGSPDLVEERLQQRLSEGGRICFWRYRVTRELTLDEVRSGLLDPARRP